MGVGLNVKNFSSIVLPNLYAVVMLPPKRAANPANETKATIGVTLMLKVVAKRVCLWVRKFFNFLNPLPMGWFMERLKIGAGRRGVYGLVMSIFGGACWVFAEFWLAGIT